MYLCFLFGVVFQKIVLVVVVFFFFENIFGLIEMVDSGSESICSIQVIVIYIEFENIVQYSGNLFFVCIFFVGY